MAIVRTIANLLRVHFVKRKKSFRAILSHKSVDALPCPSILPVRILSVHEVEGRNRDRRERRHPYLCLRFVANISESDDGLVLTIRDEETYAIGIVAHEFEFEIRILLPDKFEGPNQNVHAFRVPGIANAQDKSFFFR
jgi:hypothetical protein